MVCIFIGIHICQDTGVARCQSFSLLGRLSARDVERLRALLAENSNGMVQFLTFSVPSDMHSQLKKLAFIFL